VIVCSDEASRFAVAMSREVRVRDPDLLAGGTDVSGAVCAVRSSLANQFLDEVWVNERGWRLQRPANPSSFMVAGVGFEPTTFGL